MGKRALGAAIGAALLTAAAFAATASAKTVWLCFPGHKPDPCTPGLSTTVFSPTLQKLGVGADPRKQCPVRGGLLVRRGF